MKYKKGDVVFISYESFKNYVKILDVDKSFFYHIRFITSPLFGNRLGDDLLYLHSSNSRLCCNLERLLIGELG
jgi:hypothetical protein